MAIALRKRTTWTFGNQTNSQQYERSATTRSNLPRSKRTETSRRGDFDCRASQGGSYEGRNVEANNGSNESAGQLWIDFERVRRSVWQTTTCNIGQAK